MVSTRRRAAVSSVAAPAMADPESPKRRLGRPPKKTRNASPSQTGYERCRDERIKENLERMQKLGILDLSLSPLKSSISSSRRSSSITSPEKKPSLPHLHPRPHPHPHPHPHPLPPRRSSRLQNVTPVSYAEIPLSKGGHVLKNSSVLIEEGSKEEVYTEEHEKLLGTCGMTWILFVDGYDKDGTRIYDQIKGKTCHQCRQKTLGCRTSCCKCKLVQGQFCGDCLYMRYGENVLEANKNANWICPVCRGICNCSLCRVKKGWTPTGPLYKKVTSLGYKSVAHYLIQTRRAPANTPNENSDEPVSSEKLLTFTEAKASFRPENTLVGDFTSASVENGSNGCSDKSGILHNPDVCIGDNDAEERNVKRRIESEKATQPAVTLEPISDGIASRLRSRQSKS